MNNISMTLGQLEAIDKFEKTSRNLFITGPGGTGKSCVLSKIRKLAQAKNHRIEVLAPTAVAARIINGETWHSFFGVGILQGGLRSSLNRSLSNPDRIQRFRELNTLILDEISFIREEEFRLMNWILQSARNRKNEPFGGVRILVFGDFFQLPPVQMPGEPNPPHFSFQETRPHETIFFHIWKDANFLTVNLSENVRTTDPQFSRLLNLIRDGKHLSEDELAILTEQRNHFEFRKLNLNELLWILPKNSECENYNLSRLKKLAGPEMRFTGEFRGNSEFFKYSPVPKDVLLRLDARVMIRRNEYDAGALNGDIGNISDFGPNRITVTLDSGKSVEVEPCEFEILDMNYKVVATVVQIPLTLAYAITVHKAQGQTITSDVVLDLSEAWSPGHAYVALSRVRHRSQLLLRSSISQDLLLKRNLNVVSFYNGQYQPKNFPKYIKELAKVNSPSPKNPQSVAIIRRRKTA